METIDSTTPPLMGLFQKRIDGDDVLLRLCALRFKEAGLGCEFYAETISELEWLMSFMKAHPIPIVAHLNRGIDLFDERSQELILDFAGHFQGRVLGYVIHDQDNIIPRFKDYIEVLKRIDTGLNKIQSGTCIFIEYAVGLEPERFLDLFKAILDIDHISACIDTGHVGIWQTRMSYARIHPAMDVFTLTPKDHGLPKMIEDVEVAVQSALGSVLNMIEKLGCLGKPLHFHLHDGHPLSTFSSFGISDHLSFLEEIPIPFKYKGKRSLPPMFGPNGLEKIVSSALEALGPNLVSFSLEIHPKEGRLPLGDVSFLFDHWTDKTNAERMNYWLETLIRNHQLLLNAYRSAVHIINNLKG